METNTNVNDITTLTAHTGSFPGRSPGICPACGASRLALSGMISEPSYMQDVETPIGIGGCVIRHKRLVETENHAAARIMLENCADCKASIEAWQHRMETVKARGQHIV